MATVYFIQAGEEGPIKIGWTRSDPRARMALFQTGHYERLRLVGTISSSPHGDASSIRRLERSLHASFREYHLRGEWFAPGPRLLHHIESWSDETTRLHPELHEPGDWFRYDA
jgi:hypothetical protein